MSLERLQADLHATAKEKGWWEGVDPKQQLPTSIALMHSELSEALEEYRAGHDIEKVYYQDGKPEGVPIELADCIIRILDFCGAAGIDMSEAIRIKAEYNQGRSYRHGGKKC